MSKIAASTLADTNLPNGAQPFHQVVIWDGERKRTKLYKAYSDELDAKIAVTALRMWGMDAELVTVGGTGAAGNP